MPKASNGRRTSRLFTRLALATAFATAVVLPLLALVYRGPDHAETWMVATASLAVVAAIVSAWSSRRVLELQEDGQRPKPYPTFDFKSRYQLALLRVRNTGTTTAHNVSLEWATDLTNHDGARIGFGASQSEPAIATLLPGESISQVVDVHHAFIKSHDRLYTGMVKFEDALGTRYSEPFQLDGRPYALSPTYDEEGSRTEYELQKIPEELDKIRKAVEKLASQRGPS